MTARHQHARRPDDLTALPRIDSADVRAILWLIAFAVIVIAICAVDPTGQAAPR